MPIPSEAIEQKRLVRQKLEKIRKRALPSHLIGMSLIAYEFMVKRNNENSFEKFS